MASKAGEIGSLTVALNADTATFTSAMQKSEKEAEKWATSMVEAAGKAGAALGAAVSVGAFVASIQKAIDIADDLGDAAQRANMAVTELGAFQWIASMAGVGAGQATEAIAKLNRTLAEAAGNSPKAVQAFEAMGVAFTDSSGSARKASDVLADVADKFAGYAEGPEKGALANAIFKKGGEALLPVLNQGGDKIRELTSYWQKYSGITEESTEKAGKFNDTLDKMKLISQGATQQIANGLLPGLQAVADEFLRIRENGEMVKVIAAGIRAAFETVTVVVANVAFVFGGIGREIGAIAAQVAALARGDLQGFRAISDAVKADGERARAELEAFQRRVLGLAHSGTWKSGEEMVPGVVRDKTAAPGLPKDPTEKKLKDRTAEFERDARLIAEGEKQSAKESTEAWQAWEKQTTGAIKAVEDDFKKMWGQVFQSIDDDQARAIEAGKRYLEALESSTKDATKFAHDLGFTFVSAFEDAVISGKKLSDVIQGLARDIQRIVLRKTVTEPIGNSIAEWIKSKQGSGGGVAGLLGGLAGVFGFGGDGSGASGVGPGGSWDILDMPGLQEFATGGSFRVGGAGGTDSQLVAFRASPDETVSITRPGDLMNGAGGLTIVQHINVDARSDQASVRQAIAAASERAKAEILDSMNRGGVFRQ